MRDPQEVSNAIQAVRHDLHWPVGVTKYHFLDWQVDIGGLTQFLLGCVATCQESRAIISDAASRLGSPVGTGISGCNYRSFYTIYYFIIVILYVFDLKTI